MGQCIVDTITAAAFRVPTNGPEEDGTLHWEATEVLVVEVHSGEYKGLGYSYTAALPAKVLVEEKLASCLHGQSALDIPRHWLSLNNALRNIGRPGLGMMSVAALDQALWDLKAKYLGVPLTTLLGMARPQAEAYGSGGFINQNDQTLERQLSGWLKQGFSRVKIKIGDTIEEDQRRIALARKIVGPDVALMVDANGAYDSRTALALIQAIRPYHVSWLEEPVSSDNLAGLHWLRDRSPADTAIAAGEYGWDLQYFQHMLAAAAVDVLQADATRCGYTGFLQASVLCDAYSLPLSTHCAPALHTPLACAVPRFRHLEYFYDHARIESLIFKHDQKLQSGWLEPDLESTGHGINLNHGVAEKYAI